MAATKTPKSTARVDTPPASATSPPRAYEHGAQAASAKAVRPGFATSPEMDLAFALGHPHLVTLTDDDGDDCDEAVHAELARSSGGPRTRPLALAPRLARLFVFGQYDGDDGRTVLHHAGKDVAAKGALDAGEARALVRTALAKEHGVQVNHGHLVHLLEALIGPEDMLQIAAEELLRRTDAQLGEHNTPATYYGFWLGFGLLRARPEVAFPLREELEQRLTCLRRSGDNLSGGADALFRSLAAAARSRSQDKGDRDPWDMVHVTDDPELVAQVVKGAGASRPQLLARLAFLGDEPVLARYLQLAPKVKDRETRAELLADFEAVAGPIAHNLREVLGEVVPAKKR